MATETKPVNAAKTVFKPTPSGPNGPPKEAKDAKFRRLANARVPAAIKRIRHVANLANRLQYTYTQEQAQKIVKLLSDEVASLQRRFEAQSNAAVVADLF